MDKLSTRFDEVKLLLLKLQSDKQLGEGSTTRRRDDRSTMASEVISSSVTTPHYSSSIPMSTPNFTIPQPNFPILPQTPFSVHPHTIHPPSSAPYSTIGTFTAPITTPFQQSPVYTHTTFPTHSNTMNSIFTNPTVTPIPYSSHQLIVPPFGYNPQPVPHFTQGQTILPLNSGPTGHHQPNFNPNPKLEFP